LQTFVKQQRYPTILEIEGHHVSFRNRSFLASFRTPCGICLALAAGLELTSYASAQSQEPDAAAATQTGIQESQLPLFSVISVIPAKSRFMTEKNTADGYPTTGVS
jgi:hypothetical protein